MSTIINYYKYIQIFKLNSSYRAYFKTLSDQYKSPHVNIIQVPFLLQSYVSQYEISHICSTEDLAMIATTIEKETKISKILFQKLTQSVLAIVTNAK